MEQVIYFLSLRDEKIINVTSSRRYFFFLFFHPLLLLLVIIFGYPSNVGHFDDQ